MAGVAGDGVIERLRPVGSAKSRHVRGDASAKGACPLHEVFPIARKARVAMHEDDGLFALLWACLEHRRTHAVHPYVAKSEHACDPLSSLGETRRKKKPRVLVNSVQCNCG